MPLVLPSSKRYYSTQHPQPTSCTGNSVPRRTEDDVIFARDFLDKRLHAIHNFPDRLMSTDDLASLGVTLQHLDFKTGETDGRSPLLLLPLKSIIHKAIHRIRPWEYDDLEEPNELEHRYREGEVEPEDRCTRQYKATPEAFIRESTELSNFIHSYIHLPRNMTDHRTVQGISTWDNWVRIQSVCKFLGNESSDTYQWSVRHVYSPFEPGSNQQLDPNQPHVLCHVIDNTPVEKKMLRASELKALCWLAFAHHHKLEFNHLPTFSVTIVSIFDRQISLIQGIVDFENLTVALRVSDWIDFEEGLAPGGERYDDFLTLLGYHLSTVKL